MKTWYLIIVLMALSATASSQVPPPIIDVHLHALAANAQGPPPLALCLPTTTLGAARSGSTWGAQLLSANKNPPCPDPIWSSETDEELMEATLAVMERRNIIGVTSGVRRDMWQARAGERIIPGSRVLHSGAPRSIPLNVLRAQITDGSLQVFGEVTIQYRGMAPTDSAVRSCAVSTTCMATRSSS